MEGWSGIALTIGSASGDLKQLYPDWAPSGAVPATAQTGDQLRRPNQGQLTALQVETDGTNALTLELYDIAGDQVGADVSSGTAITHAQLTTALVDGRAKLIFRQNIAGSGLTPITPIGPRGFLKGLAARAVGSTGSCYLNMTVQDGYWYSTRGPAL